MLTWSFARGFIQNSADFHRARLGFPPRLMSTTNIGPIDGQYIEYDPDSGLVTFSSKGDCDCDGPGGSLDMDPDWQPETTLQWSGQSVDQCEVPGVVVPPAICQKTRLKVLGSLAEVSFDNGPWIQGVVTDIGPHHKLGEFTFAMHKMLKTGGTPAAVPEGIRYRTRIHTGIPARAIMCHDGVVRQYALQGYRA